MKIFLSLMILIPTLVTANVSTVFNDISSGWLTFSTYLIWILAFEENVNFTKNSCF